MRGSRHPRSKVRRGWSMVVGIGAIVLVQASVAGAGAPPTTTTAVPPSTTIPALPVVVIVGATDGSWSQGLAGPCSDVMATTTEPVVLTLRRTGDLTAELMVALAISPPDMLETGIPWTGGTQGAYLPSGRSEVTVELEPAGFNPGGDYLITLEGGDGYEVGTPASTTAHVEELDEDPGCGPPTFTAAPANTTQNVALGGALAPLGVVPYPGTTPYFALDDGSLPPGVELQPDGTFTGTATQEGTFVVVIGACTPAFVADAPPSEMPGLCVLTRLSVVVGDGVPALPVTGSRSRALALVGGALVLAGAALQLAASRWERMASRLLR